MRDNMRWFMVGLLFVAGIINYADRAALSVAAPLLSADLQLDPAQLGLVFSSFFFGYAIFCFVGGWSADRFGPKLVIVVSMTVWSLFCGLTAAVTTLAALLVVRVIFGMGEGPFSANINKLVSLWFPRQEQATAVGIANAGTPLGGAIAGPVVGFIAVSFGWRASFIAIAAVSLVWVVLWAVLARSRPADHRGISEAELRHIEGDRTAVDPAASVPLRTYLRRPAVLATAFAFFGYAYILYFFLSWFPTYLTMAQHLGIKEMGIVSVIPWLLGFIGLAGGGYVTDLVYRRTGNAVQARKLVLIISLVIAALCIALAGLVTTLWAAVLLMAISVFFMYLTGSSYWAIILDTVEEGRIGSVSGFVHFIANCAGILAPLITGYIVQFTGGFTSAFVLAGVITLGGALSVAAFVHAEPAPDRTRVAPASV